METTYSFETPHGFGTPHRFPSSNVDSIDLQNLSVSLFPTGAAWKLDSFNKILEAINETFLRLNSFGINTIDSLIPDNDNFNEEDLTLLEYVYGITPPMGSGIDQRMAVLKRRLSYHMRDYSRQSVEYLQHIIDVNGYDAKIYPNIPPYIAPIDVMSANITQVQHATEVQHGPALQHGSSNYDVIANESTLEAYSYGGNQNLWATFYIASKNSLYAPANIPTNRIQDFKKLILKVKPAHLVAFLFV